ncbi:MAG: peptidoglycan DD-metalloendopeptidase family protein [Muribaculaceae bacterium]
MNFRKSIMILGLSLAAVTFSTKGNSVVAQNLQSASNYSKTHEKLLAHQNRIQDQIRLKEAQEYASHLYEEDEPELDIYTEGWESDQVNPYKNAVIPNTKDLDVSNFCMPVPGIVTSRYGYRPRFRRMHKGIDLRLSTGDTVRAAFSGKVRLTKYERGGYGFYVVLRHDNGMETVYGHLSRFLVKPDQRVEVGQPIALGGNTGRSTGPHLHFETRFMGIAINPEAIFDFENQTTHTDIYTFNKSTFENSRNYSPNKRYTASKKRSSSSSKATHKIRQGETLSSIAARNGTTVAKLQKLNGLGNSTNIRAGKTLRLK